MATDQKTSTLNIDPESPDSAIENELPTYRAISTRAIFSLVCGAMAIFCLRSSHFLRGCRSWRSFWVSSPIERFGSIPTC